MNEGRVCIDTERERNRNIRTLVWSVAPSRYGSTLMSLDEAVNRLLVKAVWKITQVVGVTSEWVCEYIRARYILVVAREDCDKLVD